MERMKVVFLTGTRADYGKLKPLMQVCEKDDSIENYVYVIGMHLLREYGYTFRDIKADGYANIYIPENYKPDCKMELVLAETIVAFSKFVCEVKPDLIVVHGDRVEPLAGAIVGVMNNTKVAHIEGGEITGTVDEFIRHAVTKLSNLHFVSNNEAKFRLLQLGERPEDIHVFGSPDIDIMLSDTLPEIQEVKKELCIGFEKYAILIYHSVTTSTNLEYEAGQLMQAVEASGCNYIIVRPNNDQGSEIIRSALKRLESNKRFLFFDSVPFEKFLTLLKNAEFIIGNSSAGVREACVYGVPAIDVGTRQHNRYNPDAIRNIQHCKENTDEILRCIRQTGSHRVYSRYFGDGHSAEQFISAIKRANRVSFQKTFVESAETSDAIMNYINEVCF